MPFRDQGQTAARIGLIDPVTASMRDDPWLGGGSPNPLSKTPNAKKMIAKKPSVATESVHNQH